MREQAAYIDENRGTFSPVVIGAAASTASGYFSNYIVRILEKWNEGVQLQGSDTETTVNLDRVFIHVFVPETYSQTSSKRAEELRRLLSRGNVPHARARAMPFYYEAQGEEIHIIDYPTTLATSYNTARIILSLDANESEDPNAEERFIAKEMNLFECTLRTLLSRSGVVSVIDQNYGHLPSEEKQAMADRITDVVENRVIIERQNF